MVVLLTNKGYKAIFGYTDEIRNARKFLSREIAVQAASKLIHTDAGISFVQLRKKEC